jgi:hypothetical protein
MNGAKGISLLIVSFLLDKFNFSNKSNPILNKAPIQKANIIEKIPPDIPKIQPIPRESFASPNPIHLPEETSQRPPKKANKTIPANRLRNSGRKKELIKPNFINTRKRAKKSKVKTIPSGIILCIKSYTDIAISKAVINKYAGKNVSKPNFKKTKENNTPVINSTSGYWIEILLRQLEHLPFKNKKLKIGTSSYQGSSLEQEKHLDLPFTKEHPVLYLKTTTFKKLPIIVPNIKNKKVLNKITKLI